MSIWATLYCLKAIGNHTTPTLHPCQWAPLTVAPLFHTCPWPRSQVFWIVSLTISLLTKHPRVSQQIFTCLMRMRSSRTVLPQGCSTISVKWQFWAWRLAAISRGGFSWALGMISSASKTSRCAGPPLWTSSPRCPPWHRAPGLQHQLAPNCGEVAYYHHLEALHSL